MAVPRIRLSAIKPVPEQVIVPIVNTPPPETTESVEPVARGVPVPETVAWGAPVGTPDTAAPADIPDISVPVAPVAPMADAPVPAETRSDAGLTAASAPRIAVAAVATAGSSASTAEPASEAVLNASAAPSLIRSSSVVLKWSLIAAILLGVAFLGVRFLIPFLNEWKKPKSAVVVVDKEASTAVRILQQTRQVVAKNDAKVAYLNEVVATDERKPDVSKPPPAPTAPAVPRGSAAQPNLAPYEDALARLKIESVVTGTVTRAMIDGRLVRQGDIIDRSLGLRFSGVDADEHALLFTNAENMVFKKRY
jgi:hypothetical protein